jgi:hypothetical protein
LKRDPERVKVDVRDGYVSVDGAAREYGVVVAGDPVWQPEALRVDTPATEALRARMAGAAGTGGAPTPAADDPETGDHLPALESVEQPCPACGTPVLYRYPLLSVDGWFEVVKCRTCLETVSRRPWNRLGWVTLGEDTLCRPN